MPKYKLVYFNIRARGEIIRMLFAYKGVPFEDYRISIDANFQPADEYVEIKKNSPFGQLPLLEVDGQELAQSHAIERFLAREFGMDGDTSFQKAQVDMWIEAADELIRRLSDNIEEHDAKKKEADKVHIRDVVAPGVLGTLHKTVSANKTGFVIGDKLTVADLAFLSLRDWLGTVWGQEGLDVLTKYKVDDYINGIAATPAIADWLKKRPKTMY